MNIASIIKLLVLPIILLLIAGAIIWLLVLPEAKSLASNQSEIRKQNDLFEQVQAKNESLIKASKNSSQISQVSETVNDLWPDKEDISQFIVQAEGLATDKQIVLDNIAVYEAPASAKSNSSDKKTAAKTAPGTKFSFDATAAYSSLFNFISGLEKLSRFNTVSSVSLNSNVSTGQINMKLSGYIYAK